MVSSRARAYVRSRIAQEMVYTVRAERVTKPSYDNESLVATPGSRTILYTGPARIWEITGGSTINIGEDEVAIQNTQLSLPWDSPLLLKFDEILVLASPTDAAMVGKRYQIQSSAKLGQLRATRRYGVTAVN